MAILFDLDGTLLDTGPDIHKALNLLLAEENKPLMDYADFRPLISLGSVKILSHAFKISAEDPAQQDYVQKLTQRFLKLYAETGFTQTKPFAGIYELLNSIEAHNITWGVVTNKASKFAHPQLEAVGLLARSACLVAGDTTPYIKPHPKPLQYACELIKIDPQFCIYVGDSQIDVQAGKAAGMRTVVAGFGYVPSHNAALSWQADHLATNPAEILPWIEKWQKQYV